MKKLACPESKKYLDILEERYQVIPDHQSFGYYHNNEKKIINYKQLYQAVHTLSVKYYELFKDSGLGKNDMVCYLGSGFTVLNQLALMYCDVSPFMLSTKNSTEINYQLFEKSKAKVLVCEKSFEDLIRRCKQNPKLLVISNLSEDVDELCSDFDLTKNYKIVDLKDPSEQSERPIFYIHSSGTTSLPKIIPITNERMYTDMQRLNSQKNDQNYHRRAMVFLPIYHIFGICQAFSAFCKGAMLCFPKNLTDLQEVYKDVEFFQCTSLAATPFYLQRLYEYASEENKLEVLRALDIIDYGGASMPQTLGESLMESGINAVNVYGTTETGIFGLGDASKDNLDYKPLYVSEGVNCQFLPIEGENDVYEIIINPEDPGKHRSISNRPDGKYAIGDRMKFVPNTNGKAVYILGRIDDTIVHVTGEKTNPTPIENMINDNVYVEKSVLIGENRMYNCVILQLSKAGTKTDMLSVWNSIRNTISHANEISPQQSRIFEELVYILPYERDEDLPSTIKGNVSRKKASQMFEKEIENMYDCFDSSKQITLDTTDFSGGDVQQITKKLQSLLAKIIKSQVQEDQDMFKSGLDSLTVVQFKNHINQQYPGLNAKTSQVYANTTPGKLASLIHSHFNGNSSSVVRIEDHQKAIEALYEKYTTKNEYWICENVASGNREFPNNHTALITGANGSLGSYVLYTLCQSEHVAKVYSLVRAKDDKEAFEKIKQSFLEKRLPISDKIEAISYEPSSKNLGLTNQMYGVIVKELSLVYHVAWRMDFLKGVEEFEDNIFTTTELLKLAATSNSLCGYNFVSTVGAVFPSVTKDTKQVPETMFAFKVTNSEGCNGYNLSKMVTEQICSKWSDKFKIPMNIYRVGQVSGDTTNGVWNVREHVPLLIKCSQTMQMMPENAFSGGLAWIPVDTAANAIVDVSLKGKKNNIVHVVNPKNYSWKAVLEYLRTSENIKFDVVSNNEFVNQLKTNIKYQDAQTNPIASLTDFYEAALSNEEWAVELETANSCQISSDINNCSSVNSDLLSKYISYWRLIGFMH